MFAMLHCGLPWWLTRQRICLQCGQHSFYPWVEKILWRREWQPTPVFLPGKVHGLKSLWSMVSQSRTWLSDWIHTQITHHAIHLKLMQQWKSTIIYKKKNEVEMSRRSGRIPEVCREKQRDNGYPAIHPMGVWEDFIEILKYKDFEDL